MAEDKSAFTFSLGHAFDELVDDDEEGFEEYFEEDGMMAALRTFHNIAVASLLLTAAPSLPHFSLPRQARVAAP